VIAAGSLLGVAVSREEHSFPVGKVNRLILYPMNFEEFLVAMGQSDHVERIINCFKADIPLDTVYHNSLMEQYRQYLVVGGMPDCVAKFIETGDYTLIRATQKLILEDYLDDMSKYNNQNEIKKTRLTYNSITAQISKKNTRFQYKLIKSGGRAAEFENAIEWLVLSGIVTRVYALETVKKPLDNYKNIDSFKIFVSDVGLLCAKNNVLANDILYNASDLYDFKSGMTENYVCSQLTCRGHDCYTWYSDGEAEMDFVIQREGKIIPVEVKSAENSKAKSLNTYIKKFKPEYAIKVSSNNFGFDNGIKTIPLYATFCI
jgi:predicted AAA+ superfamily ATPase